MTPYRMFKAMTSSTTAMGMAISTMRRAGTIVGINWSVTVQPAATPHMGRLAVGWSATDAMDNDDTNLLIAETAIAIPTAVGTVANWCFNHFQPLSVNILDGENIYLNWKCDYGTGLTIIQQVSAIVWVNDKGGERRIVRT